MNTLSTPLRKKKESQIQTESPEQTPDIHFKEVFPLFAGSDIRNSSVLRNEAIAADLSLQLSLAIKVIDIAKEEIPMSILDQLKLNCEDYLNKLSQNISVNDETEILQFLVDSVDKNLTALGATYPVIQNELENYHSHLNKNNKMIFEKRSDYEKSVSMINQKAAKYMEEAQKEAQEIFPHLFEKQLTDGIDHSIYIGQSLVHSKKFDLVYLKNLRLWQLETVCEIDRICNRLESEIPLPLKLAHIIVVQHNTMSIRFDFEEKKFEVDGTYNIRYEIIKKRIDKAVIKGTKERLTQPHHIAIVISNDEEMKEYFGYLAHLHRVGQLESNVEQLELEDLQGIQGLRALRVPINVNYQSSAKEIKFELRKRA